MAFKKSYLDFVNKNISNMFGANILGLQMLELGDQIIKKKTGIVETTGKEYFTNLGFNHTSVDLNGNRGSLIKDLSKDTDFLEWNEKFDIITNSGTSEHVEPLDAQYTCFKIVHDCTKINGLMIHLVPDIDQLKDGYFVNHCNYYYSETFFNKLATECNYEVLENTIVENLRAVAFRKRVNSFWNNKNDFFKFINVVPMGDKK